MLLLDEVGLEFRVLLMRCRCACCVAYLHLRPRAASSVDYDWCDFTRAGLCPTGGDGLAARWPGKVEQNGGSGTYDYDRLERNGVSFNSAGQSAIINGYWKL